MNDVLPWFQRNTNHVLFRTNIDIYRNHFGGLMIIKPFPENSYRVLFITEMGIKIFDMEFFRNGDFKLYYCLDALNKKSIIKTLKNDIGLILSSILEKDKIKIMKDRQTGRTIIRSRDKTGVKYCFLEDKTNRIDEIMQTKRLLKKVNLHFYSANGIEVDSINISHYSIKLNIHLSKLNENKSAVPE
jgi:hypothetical protein